MEINPLQRGLEVSKIPLERLAGNPNVTEAEKTAEVSRQFEAILLRQILQQSQKSVFPSSLTKETAASGIYQDMITNQLADGISKSGSLGLAKSFKSQLSRQMHGAASVPQKAAASAKTITPKHS
jgi:Rod binding domain-containing protein